MLSGLKVGSYKKNKEITFRLLPVEIITVYFLVRCLVLFTIYDNTSNTLDT